MATIKKSNFFGDDAFVDKHLKVIDGNRNLSEIPTSQKRILPKSLGEYEKISINRNAAMHAAYQSGRYSLKDIG